MEGDLHTSYLHLHAITFQSTPSAWRETRVMKNWRINRHISIHSLRMEGDLVALVGWNGRSLFQSTPSAWRETLRWRYCTLHSGISIHSLRMEGDRLVDGFRQTVKDFNPLPPHGGRPLEINHCHFHHHFNPLPPHGGRPNIRYDWTTAKSFQSTPSAWRETRRTRRNAEAECISIHSLRMEGDACSIH